MFKDTTADSKPKLKLKAAEARYFVPVMLEILNRFFRSGDPYEEVRYQCYLAIKNATRSWRTGFPVGPPPYGSGSLLGST